MANILIIHSSFSTLILSGYCLLHVLVLVLQSLSRVQLFATPWTAAPQAFLVLHHHHLLISWLQSLSTVILEPKKIKSVTVSIVSHLFAMK